MAFYGVNRARLERVVHGFEIAADAYREEQRPVLGIDNMFLAMRNFSFARDEEFMAAFTANNTEQSEDAKIWRLHTYYWAGRSALRVPGDFVECGVYKGFYSSVLAAYLDFATSGKQLYLYDTFSGLAEDWSTEHERRMVDAQYDWNGTHEAVVRRFADYLNVRVIKGTVPEILDVEAPERIALLHLDLNAATAETAALDKLHERVRDGGIVLMDDYGRHEQQALHVALREWWRDHGHQVLELPTGQGLVIKRNGPDR